MNSLIIFRSAKKLTINRSFAFFFGCFSWVSEGGSGSDVNSSHSKSFSRLECPNLEFCVSVDIVAASSSETVDAPDSDLLRFEEDDPWMN